VPPSLDSVSAHRIGLYDYATIAVPSVGISASDDRS